MRCLHCHHNGISIQELTCPNCGVHLPFLMRDVLTPGTTLAGGRYLIDYSLGRGGFGITYRGRHVDLEKPVAIKEFFPQNAVRDGTTGSIIVPTTDKGDHTRALKRFIREGQILSQLDHPNVVRVTDSFQERDTAYLVMELLDGCTLRDKLESMPEKRLQPAEVKDIVDHLVSALEVIHDKGIYHLDISPDNVQITASGQIILIDFGAARQALSNSTTRSYKIAYAAPEVISGKHVGPQSDLFELGMVIYEMLTGERAPSATDRVSADDWKPHSLEDPWRHLLSVALRMDMKARPANVREWWKSFHVARPSVIIPPAKRVMKDNHAPKRRKVILPEVFKPKHKRNLNPTRRPAPGVIINNLDKARGRAPETPPGRNYRFLLTFICGILLSCVIGLGAFFITLNIFQDNSSSAASTPQAIEAAQWDHKYARLVSITVFGIVSLGTFSLFMMWFYHSRRRTD